MKTIWIDEHHVDGIQIYKTREEALEVIRDILKDDEMLLDGRDVEDISDDGLFNYGHHHYGIVMEEIKPTPCCDNEELEFDYDGETDGVTFETWKCKSCCKAYTVPIEIVRDFDNMEETDKPYSKFN